MKKYIIIFITLFVLGNSYLAISEYAFCAEIKPDVSWGDIERILDKKQIPSKKDRELIDVFLDKELSKFDKKALINVSLRFEKKIETDLFQLKNIIHKLKLSAKNSYARTVGKIDPLDVSSLELLVKDLEENRRIIRANYYTFQNEMKKSELIEGIIANAGLLTDDKEYSIVRLWERLKEIIIPSYQLWNKRFQELKAKAKKNDRPAHGAKNYFSYDEFKFYDYFKSLQAGLRRISADASSGF